LVDELRGGREELFYLAEVVLAKHEEELHRELLAHERGDQLDESLLRLPGSRLLEQGEDLLELVEDE
jgi:hypothetical protein